MIDGFARFPPKSPPDLPPEECGLVTFLRQFRSLGHQLRDPAISHQTVEAPRPLDPQFAFFAFSFVAFRFVLYFFLVFVWGLGGLFCLELPFACVGVARIVSLNNAPCLSCTRPAKHTKRNESKPSQTKRTHCKKSLLKLKGK